MPSGDPPRRPRRERGSGGKHTAGSGALARGTRVFHRRFGNGIVEECEGPTR